MKVPDWYSSAVSCTMTNSTVWDNWIRVGNMTSATTTISSQVWTIWNQHYAITSRHEVACGRISPEERDRREAQDALREQEYQKQDAARKEANRKAEVLLRSCLTQQQIDDLDGKKCFFLYSKGRKYRIDRGQHGNVKLLNERDQVVESYCIQPKGGLPDADAMLAQKLLLETDPESFRQISNVTVAAVAPLLHLPPLPMLEIPPIPRIAL